MVSLSDASAGPPLPKAPTGVRGLDEITGGGLPKGRSTLVTGGAGCGKTLLGVQFLVTGARESGEPGVLITLEESAEKVTANFASLGFDLDGLLKDGLLIINAFRAEPIEVVGTGEFNFEPLFLLLDEAIKRIGARRVVLDSIESLFGMFKAQAIVRAELGRLFCWLEDRAVTTIVTGERGDNDSMTRYGIEQYVSDCVISLDHRKREEVATRRLQVVKYRGSAHETNEYPFLISARGFTVQPVTAASLDYGAPRERISTGVPRLDNMLSGGPFRGSTVLVSGSAGTGKTTLGAHLIDAACARGERALLILHEESADEVIRNMSSVGLDLGRWTEVGLLRIWAARPTEFGLENQLATMSELIAEHAPAVAVVDGNASLLQGATPDAVISVLARTFHLFKSRGITAMGSILTEDHTESMVSLSSRADTWLLLRNVESNGERNRLLFVLKSRGTAHSNQVREFVLSDHGIELVDVYVGPAGVMTGSARIAAQQAGLDRIADREERLATDTQAARSTIGTERWVDPADGGDEAQR